ncbi:antibiotic biosynthesis monooxygenase [Pseudomonas agarici]|uniref:Antibiotic biosynthesis monooxygenase n=3 Tax=Pseudomonas agarici TaxID=46677 RepID=A0A0X1SXS6_PSEAA|nr:putative quinol monooxygenase [Pseudomonas agarici]AMB84655.1 antibiotic biosynthesis monooxygenase [Pseudomonas agarici]NWB92586.1 antibiotic biosynthesis monooxygenase [Pseudomonas agarici]NWC07587.1 antibiotic biosynthesis monooxygenase [Pseudomonas agarici]SEL06622.1 Quinol monooxygenase YgiN [Pseudomonas agarici]
MNHEIRVVAVLQAHPGKAVELEAVLKAAVVPSRAEPGCREYILHVDQSNPERFVFVERWINMAAIEKHRNTEHFQVMSAAAADLLLSRQVLLMDEVPGQ